jgi:hypothetical protein
MRHPKDDPLADFAGMATPAELHSLYLTISKRVHPDRSGSDGAQMQKLNAAWDAIERGGRGSARHEVSIVPNDVLWGLQDYHDECDEIARGWNARLTKASVPANVVPSSPGLFTVTTFDLNDAAIGDLLRNLLLEHEPF